jgi:hypothetical protein
MFLYSSKKSEQNAIAGAEVEIHHVMYPDLAASASDFRYSISRVFGFWFNPSPLKVTSASRKMKRLA